MADVPLSSTRGRALRATRVRFLARAGRLLVLAIAIGYGVANVVWAATDWTLVDVDAYWEAALRLRAGAPLYPPLESIDDAAVYRYAPWFAMAWVPLTFLPRQLVDVAWSALLIAASAAAVWPVLRQRSAAASAVAALLGSYLVLISSVGNVQPLLVATLALGLTHRSGPLWVAIAASLKATPILFAFVYVAERRWDRLALTLAGTAVLVVPMLAFDLAHYPLEAGETFGLLSISPILYVLVAGVSLAVAVWAARRRSPYVVLAAALASVLTLPRVFPYLFSFLLVPAAQDRDDQSRAPRDLT